MNRSLTVMTMVIALVLSTMAMAAAAPRWDNQVTGGGEFVAGSTYFDLAVSSRTAADDTTKGMFQYTRDDLSIHGDVDCLYIAGSGSVAMSGYVKVQEGLLSGDYVSVEIRADGQAVRVRAVSSAVSNCGYSGSYGATLVEGSFNLR